MVVPDLHRFSATTGGLTGRVATQRTRPCMSEPLPALARAVASCEPPVFSGLGGARRRYATAEPWLRPSAGGWGEGYGRAARSSACGRSHGDGGAVDIKPASDAALEAVLQADVSFRDARHQDFVLGNIKARQRMIAQYAVAGGHNGLVVGTDHAAEAVSGFFTKFGDGAADVVPLSGLTKRRVRAVADALGAPAGLARKVPTADLETLSPGRTDEDALGVTYDDIDDFLEGKPVDEDVFETIVHRYRLTDHKRRLPIAP